jgi:hypothetical protein
LVLAGQPDEPLHFHVRDSIIIRAETAMPDFDFNFRLDDVPVKQMQPGSNMRKDPDEAALVPLGESLLVRQFQPVILDPEFFIIDGWRRWLAAQRVGLDTLKAVITDRPLTKKELRIAQLMMSVHHCSMTGAELYMGCYSLLQEYPDMLAKDIALHAKLSPSMMTRVLSPSKCIEPVRKALMENRIGLSHCYEISKAPEEQQMALLEQRLNGGASRDELGRQRRKGGKQRSAGSGRVAQARCVLQGGACVMVSAKAISMQSVVQALSDALKAAKKGCEEGFDVKTWEAMMRDKSKGNGRDASAA